MLRTESTYEIHYIQSPDNSQSFNRYSYCQNNPLRYTDPTGWQLVGGTRPRPQGFYDKWGDYYSRPAYEPRDFGIVQLSDANPDIAWMEANDLRRGGRNETKGGGSPVYDEHGYFLGTDDGGLQGVAIVMRREDFRQGMKHDDALALAVDLDDNNQDAEIRFYMHYSQLCNRPDWDGYDFDMKPWRNPLNWGRNIETMIGNKVAGNGTPFNIYFYGSYQLTPILPWIK